MVYYNEGIKKDCYICGASTKYQTKSFLPLCFNCSYVTREEDLLSEDFWKKHKSIVDENKK